MRTIPEGFEGDWIAIHTPAIPDGPTILGWSKHSPAFWPETHYFVQLPSGLRHYFETETKARASQYWPETETYPDLLPAPHHGA